MASPCLKSSVGSCEASSSTISSSWSSAAVPGPWRRPCSLSFRRSISVRLPVLPPSYQMRIKNQAYLQIKAGTGYYPASISWWKKGDQANMRDVHSGEEFYKALEEARDKLVLVDFYSAGCRSCKALFPKICQLAADNPDILVLKVNFYDNEDFCRSLNVSMLPFFHIYRGSEGRVDAFSCSLTKISKLREKIAKHKRGRVPVPHCSKVAKSNDRLAFPASTLAAAGAPS